MAESALTPLLAREPLGAELVVMMEPTDNAIHAGCLGNINATWTFTGRAGHSARPWDGDNAIHKAAHGIAALAAHEPEEHDFGGLKFYEVGVGDDDRGRDRRPTSSPTAPTAQLNYRYAPGRSPEEAEARLLELTGGHGEIEVTSNSPSGPGAARQPARRAAAGRPADRAQAGVDAGGGVRAGRPGRDQLRPRASRRRRTAATSRCGSTPSCAPTACWRRSPREALPDARRAAHVPVRAAHRGQAAPRGRRRGLRRLRDGRAARGDAGLHPRGARGRDRAALELPLGRRPARAARGDRRLGGAALRRRARPRPRDRPDARLQGGDLPPRAGRRRRADRHPDARLPRLRARRRVRRQASCSSCR